jgi:hypothetical protein
MKTVSIRPEEAEMMDVYARLPGGMRVEIVVVMRVGGEGLGLPKRTVSISVTPGPYIVLV